jgi:hypothetical protein
MYKR